METIIADLAGNPVAPAPSQAGSAALGLRREPPVASEAELRLSLRQAIEARGIADAGARDAKEVADKAGQEKRLAGEALEHLRASQEAAGKLALQEHARALEKALKAGTALPPTTCTGCGR